MPQVNKKNPAIMAGFHKAEPTGLEPAASGVTGRRSNQVELRLQKLS
jgi:hypothetical protein